MSAAPADFLHKLAGFPAGTFFAALNAHRYSVTKSRFGGGKSIKLVAEELGGSDYISCNVYYLASGPRIYPCEMPLDKVLDFVRCARVLQDAG